LLSEEEVREARRTVGEVKNELTAPVQEFKDGVKHSVDELKAEAAIPEEADGPTINSPPDEDGKHRLKDGRDPLHKDKTLL
jgi:hypothetical protein